MACCGRSTTRLKSRRAAVRGRARACVATARTRVCRTPVARTGPLEPAVLHQIIKALRLTSSDIRHHQWVDNGPGWCAVMLSSASQVLSLQPDWAVLHPLKVGVVGPHPPSHEADFEVRAFIGHGVTKIRSPGVCASLAQWLIGAGLSPSAYVAAQGTAMQRAGRVHLRKSGNEVWVGGDVVDCIEGEVDF